MTGARWEAAHSDAHGQSVPISGLAYLLGIQLMPRIRNWEHLVWCRPSPESRHEHIGALFSEDADWQMSEPHLPDMLRAPPSHADAGLVSNRLP